MSKVISFSQTFPSYHYKAGKTTDFVLKIWKGLYELNLLTKGKVCEISKVTGIGGYQYIDDLTPYLNSDKPAKFHTIRSGNKWKAGDYFSPRVWGTDINPKSGRSGAYHSKQIIIAPDIKIEKVWNIEMDLNGVFSIDGFYLEHDVQYQVLAMNDGLTEDEMFAWFMRNFNKPNEFKGQIICWNPNINY